MKSDVKQYLRTAKNTSSVFRKNIIMLDQIRENWREFFTETIGKYGSLTNIKGENAAITLKSLNRIMKPVDNYYNEETQAFFNNVTGEYKQILSKLDVRTEEDCRCLHLINKVSATFEEDYKKYNAAKTEFKKIMGSVKFFKDFMIQQVAVEEASK